MKLPIKKKWFDEIRSGKKNVEYRDAHITFVCEETGETFKMNVKKVQLLPIDSFTGFNDNSNYGEDFFDNFEDDIVIAFDLESPPTSPDKSG